MKITLTLEQEDKIYYKRLKEVEKAVILGEIEFDSVADYQEAVSAFCLVREI